MLTRTCREQYFASKAARIASCAAVISFAAMPSLRCVRSTAREVMWPCVVVESSSSLART